MKLFNTKIISLVLGAFLFQLFLVFANGAFANSRPGACGWSFGDIEPREMYLTSKQKKAVQKALDKGTNWKSLEEVWTEILFNPNLSPLFLARTIKTVTKTENFNAGDSYIIIQRLINGERIRQAGVFDFFPSELHLSEINSIYVTPDMKARKLPLIEAMDAGNPKLVAIAMGLGADVYLGSPYNAEVLSMMNGVVGSARNPNDFEIRYPIPLVLYRFYAGIFFRSGGVSQKILELLLESSDPKFRYNHNEMDKQFNELFNIKYPGNPKIDRERLYGVRDGASDLMLVAQYGNAEILKSLIEKGHDITAKDKEGRGVEDYAQWNKPTKTEEILKTLKEYNREAEDMSRIYVGPQMRARELPLVQDIARKELTSVLRMIGLGVDVYAVSPYGHLTLETMNGVVKSSRENLNPVVPSHFSIKYPIPFALERFSTMTDDFIQVQQGLFLGLKPLPPRPEGSFSTQNYQKIVEALLEKSDPDFRYNYDVIEQQFGKFIEETTRDKFLMYGVFDGASDLMLVAQYGTADMLISLIKKGHDITAKDKEGRSLEDYARLNDKHSESILAELKKYKDKPLLRK